MAGCRGVEQRKYFREEKRILLSILSAAVYGFMIGFVAGIVFVATLAGPVLCNGSCGPAGSVGALLPALFAFGGMSLGFVVGVIRSVARRLFNQLQSKHS